jgi:hypothetical protein
MTSWLLSRDRDSPAEIWHRACSGAASQALLSVEARTEFRIGQTDVFVVIGREGLDLAHP